MTRFEECLKVVLGHEGGISDDPDDKGGLTKWGITQSTYDNFNDRFGCATHPVTEMTMEECKDIYSDYWRDSKASFCPKPLDLCMFDSAVNHGPSRAIKLLQKALGVDADGVFGKQTIGALHEELLATDAEHVTTLFLTEREYFYGDIVKRDPTQRRFLSGWLNRIDHLRELV